jgi:hypothetical protein
MAMLIAILNQYSDKSWLSDKAVGTMAGAIAKQVRLHAAPIWDRTPAAVVFYPSGGDVPEGAHGIAVVDTIKNVPEGVLGFHTEDHGGKLWGVVAVDPVRKAGGQPSTGDWSVSSVLSHEVLEMFVDPNCNLWANDGKGKVYSVEVCDPVEAPTYTVDGVSVSNFVTPAWFDPLEKGAQVDYLDELHKKPFTLLPGGYLVYSSAGAEHQKQGAKYPEWRRETKSGELSRTHRRITELHAAAERRA